MTYSDASLIPPGPPPLDAPPPIPERRRLRWWMVAIGTIVVAAVLLGAGLALAAVIRDDGDDTASNRAPGVDLPGGLSGVSPVPIDSVPEVAPSGSTTSTIAGVTPGPQPTTAPQSPGSPLPTTVTPGPAQPSSPPVTNRPPIGPGQIPAPTSPPRCTISNFGVNPDTVAVSRNGRLTQDVTVSFTGNAACQSAMVLRIMINNRTTRTFEVPRNGSSFVYVINGPARNDWSPGDYIVQVEDRNGQFKGALPLEVVREDD